ncbi:hypothetical protein L0F63_003078 [Massospora cicadina]|nr:hypothetical protein L0F63_003078 [Massospora cicadina]
MTPACFIDFRPYKGYFDLGFLCEADAATAATFSGLPTRLPPEVLHRELMEGLAAYGANPILQFQGC